MDVTWPNSLLTWKNKDRAPIDFVCWKITYSVLNQSSWKQNSYIKKGCIPAETRYNLYVEMAPGFLWHAAYLIGSWAAHFPVASPTCHLCPSRWAHCVCVGYGCFDSHHPWPTVGVVENSFAVYLVSYFVASVVSCIGTCMVLRTSLYC